jgi:hypothetical protein
MLNLVVYKVTTGLERVNISHVSLVFYNKISEEVNGITFQCVHGIKKF